MSKSSSIGIIGGDQRQVYMALELIKRGYHIYTYELAQPIHHQKHIALSSLKELFQVCEILIGPIPLTRDQEFIYSSNLTIPLSLFTSLLTQDHSLLAGMLPASVTQYCNLNKIPCYDLMKNEKVTILNAIATAEGTIMEAILNGTINLHGSNCLILGYGRCAKVLAWKLKGLDGKITVAARSEEALAYATANGFATLTLSKISSLLPSYDFIFNTIPSMVLDANLLDLVKEKVTIIDIASAPGGVDFKYANEKKINAKLCLGLPGKVSPQTSADILVDEIISIVMTE